MSFKKQDIDKQAYLKALCIERVHTSHYKPMTAVTANYLSKYSNPDIGVALENFADARGWTLGSTVDKKKARFTNPKAKLLIKLCIFIHTYNWKGIDSLPIPTNMFGKECAMNLSKLLEELEVMGCLECVQPRSLYYKYDEDHSVACSWRVDPIFRNYCWEIVERFNELREVPKVASSNSIYASMLPIPAICISSLLATQSALYPSYINIRGGSNSKRGGTREYGKRLHLDKLRNTYGVHTYDEVMEQLLPYISIKCKTCIPAYWSDEDCELALNEKYNIAELKSLHNLVDIKDCSTQIRWTITRDKDGTIESIGMRPTNRLCKTYNEDHDDKAKAAGISTRRHEVIELLGAYNHVDLHCSIYNMEHALRTNSFTNEDFYQKAADKLGKERSVVKKCFMKCNFGEIVQGHLNGKSKCSDSELTYENDSKKIVRTGIKYCELEKAMIESGLCLQGTNTEIFLWEDIVYTHTQRVLAEEGIKSVRVYDSFYTDKPVSEQHLVELINEVLNDSNLWN